MKHIKAKISYDGSYFNGFARQRHENIISVSERIELALKSMGIDDEIIGAGRTDKGVHSTGQIISFFVPSFWSLDRLKNLLNQKLYPHILIKNLNEVSSSFHPRFDAKKRAYRYIFTKDFMNPFLSNYISKLDFGDNSLIQQALKEFVGIHCFSYFKKQGSQTKNDIREIMSIKYYEYKILSHECGVICFVGNGFLRSQIRMILGMVFAYSRGEVSIEDIKMQLECKKHIWTYPVSPNGLYLTKIQY